MFPEVRYLQKIIGEIIKLFNMPPFIPKIQIWKEWMTPVELLPKAIKKIGGAQKKIDIASSQG